MKMSLFERIKNKRQDLTEQPGDFTSKQRKDNINMLNKMFGSKERSKKTAGDVKKTANISNKKETQRQKKIIKKNVEAGDKLLQDINKRKSADLTRADAINRAMGTSSSTEGAAGAGGTTTKTRTVKQSEVSKQAKEFTKKINKKRTGSFDDVTGEGQVKYPKNRKDLIAKRKEYGIDRKGNISDAGVKRYAQKTKQLSSGSNLPVTPTQKELDLAKKRAVGGTPIKNKAGKVIGTTTGKYGGKLSRKRPSNAPSLAQIKSKIDAENPTYKSPITGGKLPLKDPDLKRMSSADRKIYQRIKDTTPKGGMPKGTVLPDGTIKPKLPRKVYVKTPKSVAFPQGLKPVDTKTKEGEKLARKITKKFVTDKELLTGEKPKQYKPPVNNKSKNSSHKSSTGKASNQNNKAKSGGVRKVGRGG